MLPRVLRKGSASLMTEESSGNTVKLSGKSYQAFATALGSKDLPSCTKGKTRGYGKKVMTKDNPQPSSKVEKLRMLFRDLMSVVWYENTGIR